MPTIFDLCKFVIQNSSASGITSEVSIARKLCKKCVCHEKQYKILSLNQLKNDISENLFLPVHSFKQYDDHVIF